MYFKVGHNLKRSLIILRLLLQCKENVKSENEFEIEIDLKVVKKSTKRIAIM